MLACNEYVQFRALEYFRDVLDRHKLYTLLLHEITGGGGLPS